MAPVKRNQQNQTQNKSRRVLRGRVQRPRQNLTRRLANMAISSLPKLMPRRNFPSRTNRRGAININSTSTLNGTERVATVTIPVASTPGQLLFTLENNPNSAPRAKAVASQFDSWHSTTEIEVETTGNAFAKNFIIIRHIPNGDPSRIPSDPQSLLNFSEAYSRKGESFKLQLDSNGKGVVRAPWTGISYNPRKPVNDTDPSERNNGLFIIVSNGSPGAEPVDITIRYRYSFKFYGPIFQSLLPNLSFLLTGGSGFTPAAPFPANMVVSGPGVLSRDSNSITLRPGDYLLNANFNGTGITAGFTPISPGITFSPIALSVGATQSTQIWSFSLPSTATILFLSLAATTVSSVSVRAAPYDLTI